MNGLVLTTAQVSKVFHQAEQVITTAEQLIAVIPGLPDDQLVEAYRFGLQLEHASWRIRAAVAGAITTRINERQARGKYDLEGQEIKKALLQLAKEAGVDLTTLYEDARIEKTFFSSCSATTRENMHGDLQLLPSRDFYRAALHSKNPQETIEKFAREKAANPHFTTKASWQEVRKEKAPPMEQPIPPLIEDPAVKRAWEAYGQSCAELARTTKAAGVPLGRILLGCTNELREEVQRPGTTRRQQLLDLIAGAVDEIELIALHLSVDRIWVATWLNRLESEGAVESFEKPRAPGARGQARTGYRLRSK